MGASLSTISNVLKNFYLGPVRNQINSKVLAIQVLQLVSENLEGLQAVLPLHTSRSSGVGARVELEALPSAGNQVFAQAVYDLKSLYGRVQVSGQAIQKSSSDAGSFLRVMKAELDFIKDDLAVDFARQVYGDGTGQVAQCGVTSASATVVLSSAEAIRKGFLHIGMLVDLGTAADPDTLAQGIAITALNLATPSITLASGSYTVTSANFVYRANNVDRTTGVSKEMDGLRKILPTAANTLGGINAASAGNEYWDNLRDTAGSAIGLNKLMTDWNLANAAGAMADQAICLTTPGLVRLLFGSADFGGSAPNGNVRFVNTKVYNGGFSSITFDTGGGPIELVSDRHAPYGNVYIIDKEHIKLFSPADWDFMQRDGLTIRQVAGFDAYEAVLFKYANMGCDRRNSSLVLNDDGSDTTGA